MAELDIAAFLRARLDEQEADSTGPPDSDSVHALGCDLNSGYDLNSECWPDWPVKCDCGEPEWQLADVAAKRQIIELHKPVGISVCDTCHSGWTAELNPADFPCPTMRLLALPYAGHPEFREEWRP